MGLLHARTGSPRRVRTMESNSVRRSFLRTGLAAFGGLLAAMGSRMGGDAEAAHTKMGVGSKKR